MTDPAMVKRMALAWRENLDAIYSALLEHNATSWDISFANSYNVPGSGALTVPKPTIVSKETCLSLLEKEFRPHDLVEAALGYLERMRGEGTEGAFSEYASGTRLCCWAFPSAPAHRATWLLGLIGENCTQASLCAGASLASTVWIACAPCC